MLTQALLSTVEQGLNRVLQLDSTALARLAPLQSKVIKVSCPTPALHLYLLPGKQGLLLSMDPQSPVTCHLRAPASQLMQLALSQDKTRVLHQPEVVLEGDSAVLLELADVLQSLELDWEYELSRWLGPVASQLIGSHLRSRAQWGSEGISSLRQNLADFLSEESRTLVGQREANARFSELDQLKLALERLDARIERLTHKVKTDP